ncbi:aspartate/glutamate racemase family protein [Teredinibacter sp. KSP-S5-2]|uniref:aspartate/glutamate racemase family protein n=1 Tax=Teredinibacter sp. KSP-S5-2 TaxID=3034506 RepID=UPI002934F5C9|nr:aspartate/glutamate racemase family protein [Teredinibacter sp. KSP-S5-2]WNO10734.1 aspartate/glutamate racemase family protein [Teredinibacter sp. KSP-S5-2]
MKTAGLIGGMSWESTMSYYQAINQGIKQKLGGLNSAQIVMYSVNFAPIEKLQHTGDWAGAAEILVDAAKRVEAGGADFILICTNTMHKVYDEIADAVGVPVIHIADATAETLVEKQVRKVGLLGTRFTMGEDFYKSRLNDKYGIEVLIPDEEDRLLVDEVIFNELCLGIINEQSKQEYLRIIQNLHAQGAEAVILGCTEIGMLLSQEDIPVVFLVDTTKIHAQKAVDEMIEGIDI